MTYATVYGILIARGKLRIEAVIGIAVGIVGLVAYVVKITMDYQKLKDNHEELQRDVTQYVGQFCKEHRDIETDFQKEQAKNSDKFKELYHSRNENQTAVAQLASTVNMLVQSLDKQYSFLENNYKSLEKQLADINTRLTKMEK